jgi:hypothetical protein
VRNTGYAATFALRSATSSTAFFSSRSPAFVGLSVSGTSSSNPLSSSFNVNLLRYFSEPATLDGKAQAFLQRGMALAMEWATQGLVVPHVSQTIDGTVEAINAGLQSLKAGHGTLGKVAVLVDRALAGEKSRLATGPTAREPARRLPARPRRRRVGSVS